MLAAHSKAKACVCFPLMTHDVCTHRCLCDAPPATVRCTLFDMQGLLSIIRPCICICHAGRGIHAASFLRQQPYTWYLVRMTHTPSGTKFPFPNYFLENEGGANNENGRSGNISSRPAHAEASLGVCTLLVAEKSSKQFRPKAVCDLVLYSSQWSCPPLARSCSLISAVVVITGCFTR